MADVRTVSPRFEVLTRHEGRVGYDVWIVVLKITNLFMSQLSARREDIVVCL